MKKRNLEVIEMRLFKNKSYVEIGEKFNITKGSVEKIVKQYHKDFFEYLKRKEKIKEKVERMRGLFPMELEDLSARTRNVLEDLDIQTVNGLSEKTMGELLRCRNLGPKSVQEILVLLKVKGLTLKDYKKKTRTYAEPKSNKTRRRNQ